jgi:hypothetical protein
MGVRVRPDLLSEIVKGRDVQMTTQNFNSQCPILILKREKLGKTSLSSLREQAKKLGIIRYYSLKKVTLKELVERRF